MFNKGSVKIGIVQEISDIFLAMQLDERKNKDKDFAFVLNDTSSNIKFIPIITSIESVKKDIIFKNMCIELLSLGNNVFLFSPEKNKLDVYFKLSFDSNEIGVYSLYNDTKKDNYKFLYDQIKGMPDKKYIFIDYDLDIYNSSDLITNFNMELLFFVSTIQKKESERSFELIMDILAKNNKVKINLVLCDCNPNIKLDNFFTEFHHYFSENLSYCGILPIEISNYQVVLGDRLIHLSGVSNLFKKHMKNLVLKFILGQSACYYKLSECKGFIDNLEK